MTRVILAPMKTAISLPDDLFRRAEALADRLGIPRSQLFARALAEYLAAHDAEQVTAALDALYADQPSELDESVAAAQAVAVAVEEW
jgi:predicted transcriptional regulator